MDISGWTSGLFIPQRRSIGGIHAQVTIREQERDELQITEHPVEQGAPIADHAFKRPAEVQIRAGWDCTRSGNLSANGGGVYAMLLQWQASLNPFDLYTGKRTYKHMLIQSLTVTTDAQSEFALMADIVCRQVIIVATKTGTAAKNPDNMKSPESNGGASDKGNQQPRAVESTTTTTNTSDYGGGSLPSSAPAGEESLSVREEGYLTDSGPSPPGPEGQKVETTIEKNDPTDTIRENKGIETRIDIGDDYLNDAPSPPGPKGSTLMPPSRLLQSKPKIPVALPNIVSLRTRQPKNLGDLLRARA